MPLLALQARVPTAAANDGGDKSSHRQGLPLLSHRHGQLLPQTSLDGWPLTGMQLFCVAGATVFGCQLKDYVPEANVPGSWPLTGAAEAVALPVLS